ncbi:MAG: hypothetical protein PCFJNLEI_04089 [Verrucomicrobiae bacterium]|nr:hypothetical protein [Verrucomicrobiae bacterium]
MALESTLTGMTCHKRTQNRVRRDAVLGKSQSEVCHAEPVEAFLSFRLPVRFHPSSLRLHPFLPGWLVATNLNNILKEAGLDETPQAVLPWQTIIKPAAEIAGLFVGNDAIVGF